MKNTDFILANSDNDNTLSFTKEELEKYNSTLYVNSFPIDKTDNAKIVLSDASYMNILQSDNDKSLKIQNTEFLTQSEKSNDVILKSINTPNASYQVLETNPKLTGNIKVVIDSNSNIFIDTFKITDALSKDKYRKVPVSYKDYYGKNIMSIFKNVPSDDIFKISTKYYDMFTTTSDMSNQYADTYRCGARVNTDKLYKENFSILAPLYINHILPDFFVVFKVKGVVDLSNSTNIMKYLIKNGEQLACFDLRLNTKLGTYLRNIQKNADNFENDFYISKTDNSSHQITGISIDKGVVAKKYENRNKNPYYEQNNDVEYCNYFTSMFESKRMVNSRLINFEFMFDDNTEVEQFEMNTYFGLYLCANNLNSNIFVDTDKYGKIIFKNSDFIDTSLSTALDSLKDNNDIIYGYTSDEWFRRETPTNKSTILEDLIKKEGKNILSTDAIRLEDSINNSFLSITLNHKFEAGEHIKFILTTDLITHYDYVYEIIFSDCSLYKDSIISDSIITYNNDYKKQIIINRISCYVSENESIAEQIKHIKTAFRKLGSNYISIIYSNENTLTFGFDDKQEASNHEAYFQYISNKSYKTDNAQEKLTYFGKYDSKLFVINPLQKSDFENKYNGVFMPLNFELAGKRGTSIIKFANIPNGGIPFEINSKTLLSNNSHLKNTLLVAFDNSKNVDELYKFSIVQITENALVETEKINVLNSYKHPNAELILLTKNICADATNGDIYLYDPYYINYVICGMLNVKQLDFNINPEDIYKYIDLKSNDSSIDASIIMNKYNTTRKYDISPIIPSKCNWSATGVFNEDSSSYNSMALSTQIKHDNYIDSSFEISNTPIYRNKLLNNEISIEDLLYSLSNNKIYHINTYSISDSKIEFIYNNIRYYLNINNIELLSSKDISNSNLYIVNSPEVQQEYSWELFIDKQNNDILIIHYNSCDITSDKTIFSFVNSSEKTSYDIVEFNVKEKTHELVFDNDKSTIVSAQNINIPKYNYEYGILNANHFSVLSNKISLNSEGNLIFKNTVFTNNYFAQNGTATTSKNIDIFPLNENITCYLFKIHDTKNIISDSYNELPTINSISANNIGIYIKNENKYADYSKLEPVSFDAIDSSIQGNKLNQTIYTFNTYDVIDYEKIENTNDIIISKYNNVRVNNVNTLSNLWFTKYTDNTNYCIEKIQNETKNANDISDTSSLLNFISCGHISNYETLMPSLSKGFYKKYANVKNSSKNEAIFDIDGTLSGEIKTTFFNSIALLLKNQSITNIEISSWYNTYIKDDCIYFNITYSLIQKILHSVGFAKLWNQLKVSNENTKINFIYKTILQCIPLSANNIVSVYTKQKSNNEEAYSNTLSKGMVENKNIKAEIISEKNNLYVKLTPSKTENNKYYIKYNITL